MKDWEEKHNELCKKGREEWKKKKGAEAREETGLKEMEGIFKAMAVTKTLPEHFKGQQNLVEEGQRNLVEEVKEMCEKKGSAGKAGKDLKHKKHGVDRKVKGDSKEPRKEQEEHCKEVKLGASKMTMPESVKVEMVEVKKSGQKLGRSGKAERSVKKSRGKGGELSQVEEKVRGERESASEVD